MGLSKEVRDFFTNKIQNVIDGKIKDAKKNIDEEAVLDESVRRMEKHYGLAGMKEKWMELEEEEAVLKKAQDETRFAIREALQKNPKNRWLSNWNCDSDRILQVAREEFYADVMKETYPETMKEIAKLEAMTNEVYGAVLLATTERKLLENLRTLLTNYGGDIDDIWAVLPKSQYT